MRSLLAAVLLLPASGLLANDAKVRTTAHLEIKKLRGPGAAEHARALYGSQTKWRPVSRAIETGQGDWLQVAVLLNGYADGSFSEELNTAMALALLNHPANVLRAIRTAEGPGAFSIGRVCAAPIPTPGKAWLKRYKAQAIRALRGVSSIQLRPLRDGCLKTLHGVDTTLPSNAYD